MKATEGELVFRILQLQSRIQQEVGGALSAHGIGLSDYLVMDHLYGALNRKTRRCDLAAAVGLTPSGITRLLGPMEKIGLIQKEVNPRDARVSLVTLSAAGKQIFEEAKVSFEHASASLFEPLEAKQVGKLSKLITGLV